MRLVLPQATYSLFLQSPKLILSSLFSTPLFLTIFCHRATQNNHIVEICTTGYLLVVEKEWLYLGLCQVYLSSQMTWLRLVVLTKPLPSRLATKTTKFTRTIWPLPCCRSNGKTLALLQTIQCTQALFKVWLRRFSLQSSPLTTVDGHVMSTVYFCTVAGTLATA